MTPLIWIALLSTTQPAPRVRVEFSLDEERFRRGLPVEATDGSTTLGDFERSSAMALRDALNEHIGYLSFVDGSEAGEYTLEVAIAPRKGADLQKRHPTDFHLSLFGLESKAPLAALELDFREAGDFTRSTQPELFLVEIHQRLGGHLETQLENFVTGLFSPVSLASSAYVVLQESSTQCALPFSLDTIRAAPDSRFALATEIPGALAPEPRFHHVRALAPRGKLPLEEPYASGAVATEENAPFEAPWNHTPMMEVLEAGEYAAELIGIHVIEYRPVPPVDPDDEKADNPAAVSFGASGGGS